ncbi:PE-PPE domain-containing protein [Mycolicibacterium goodii]|uniref:PE-PPE domain-containing protein n=1 Tax=Mycolicibacterium goodii TaxID=134601 RepID=UPI000C2568D4|nr:PE-PPE domain-containing protein [Mycolicibacterium goodii]PJK18997.1 PE-PPE domain-containing protein [Mycolicibacterium goodii]
MGIDARSIPRTILVTAVVLIGAVALAFASTISSAVRLVATYALIVPGTGTPNPAVVQNYMENAVDHYLVPGGDCVGGCEPPIAVPYIAQFWPIPLPGWGGLEGAKWNVSVASGVTSLTTTYNDVLVGPGFTDDDHISIFGYSQGATVSSIVKGNLDNPANADQLNFFFIGNPQRPNGGFFERLAFLGTVPILDATFGNPTPTDTCEHSDGTHCATDFALMYDGVADFPAYPLNLLATANALAGFWYVHGTYLAPDDDEPPTATPYGYTPAEIQAAIAAANEPDGCTAANHCQRHGDTIYVTLPARTLPIMQPLLDLGSATGTSALVIPIVDLISPLTQTLIETGYNRADYGRPTPAGLIPRIDPVKLVQDLVNDIPEGINAALTPGLTPLPGSTTVTVQAPVAQRTDTENRVQTGTDDTTDDAAAPNTDTDPATGGNTDPGDATTGPDPTDALAVSQAADESEPLAETPKANRKPVIRISPVAQPNEATTAGVPKAERPSLRKALGLKGHPVRDLVRSVGKALGVNGRPAKTGTQATDDSKDAKDAKDSKTTSATKDAA